MRYGAVVFQAGGALGAEHTTWEATRDSKGSFARILLLWVGAPVFINLDLKYISSGMPKCARILACNR